MPTILTDEHQKLAPRTQTPCDEFGIGNLPGAAPGQSW